MLHRDRMQNFHAFPQETHVDRRDPMLSKLVVFVSLFSLSAAGMVMSAATPKSSAARGSCCAGCPLCGEDCTCSCASGCLCCAGGACVCEACTCPCCSSSSSAKSLVKISARSLMSSCSPSGTCCSATKALFELTTSDEAVLQVADASRPLNLSGGCCSGCSTCGDACDCACPADCGCCSDGGCSCDNCSCPCCAAK